MAISQSSGLEISACVHPRDLPVSPEVLLWSAVLEDGLLADSTAFPQGITVVGATRAD